MDKGLPVEGASQSRKQCGSFKKRRAYEDEIKLQATSLENTLNKNPDVSQVFVSDVACEEVKD